MGLTNLQNKTKLEGIKRDVRGRLGHYLSGLESAMDDELEMETSSMKWGFIRGKSYLHVTGKCPGRSFGLELTSHRRESNK